MAKYTKEQIEEMIKQSEINKARAAADAIENDRRRACELNRLCGAFNKLRPVLHAAIDQGVKVKNDGRAYGRDFDRINAALNAAIPFPCHANLVYKYHAHGDQWRGNWALHLSGYYNEIRPGDPEPRTVPIEVRGYVWIDDTGTPVALENIKIMKVDRTVEAITAARVELANVEQEIAALKSKASTLQDLILC